MPLEHANSTPNHTAQGYKDAATYIQDSEQAAEVHFILTFTSVHIHSKSLQGSLAHSWYLCVGVSR